MYLHNVNSEGQVTSYFEIWNITMNIFITLWIFIFQGPFVQIDKFIAKMKDLVLPDGKCFWNYIYGYSTRNDHSVTNWLTHLPTHRQCLPLCLVIRVCENIIYVSVLYFVWKKNEKHLYKNVFSSSFIKRCLFTPLQLMAWLFFSKE